MPEMDGNRVNEISVITCIAAPNDAVEAFVLRSLAATTAEFPGDRRMAAVDIGTPAIEKFLADHDWEIVRPDGLTGMPARMGRLLRRCVERTESPVIWTVEHDAGIWPGNREWVTRKLLSNPTVAGIECRCLHRTEAAKRTVVRDGSQEIIRGRLQIALNCTAWKAQALRAVDWSAMSDFSGPGWGAPDAAISIQLRRFGWQLCVTSRFGCDHWQAEARSAIDEERLRGRNI
jgi:hypothetical protein